MFATTHYETVYKFKKVHLETRNRGLPILLNEEINGKLLQ